MSEPFEHIKVIMDELQDLQTDGHITEPDEFVAINDVEVAVHALRRSFEYKINNCNNDNTLNSQ